MNPFISTQHSRTGQPLTDGIAHSPVWHRWAPAALLTLGLALSGLLASATPQDGHAVAVILPPWHSFADAATTVAAAGGTIKGTGLWDSIVTTSLEGPDGAERLRHNGAWLVIDAAAARGCLTL